MDTKEAAAQVATAADKLTDTVNNILLTAIDKAKEGADFLAGQIPDVVQQLLKWNLTMHIFYGVLWLVLVAAIYKAQRFFFPKLQEEEEGLGWVTLAGVPVQMAFFALSVGHWMDAAQIWIAPKVWLLEYAAHLVKAQ